MKFYPHEMLHGSPWHDGQAQRWCKRLHWFSAGACVWLIFYPRPYDAAIAVSLALPFLGLLMLWRFEGIAGFNVRAGRPDVTGALLMPGLGLCMRTLLDWNVLAWPAFWVPFAAIALGFFGCALLVKEIRQKASSIFFLALMAAIYGAGATLNLNAILADGKVASYHAKVLHKYVSGGRVTLYNLRLAPWGNLAENDAEVTHATYSKYEIGDTVEILLRTGKFGIPFYCVR